MNLFKIIGLFGNLFSLSLNSSYMNTYNEYIQKYNKTFSLDNFEIFKQNVKDIEAFNSENNSYKMEINAFTDKNITENNYYIKDSSEYYSFKDMIVPEKVDWREKNAVTHVKNQLNCGSCWSFSTTGSVEGVVAINSGNLYNLSEQQLVDCSSSEGNQGCNGGSMDQGFQYIIDNGGICSESEYPYTAEQGDCQSCKNVVQINKYMDIERNDEKILKRAVAQQPVSVAIQANLQSFQMYSHGIYSDDNCGEKLDHGVLIVGYGKDVYDYWIVKNSWGKDWGENGYIRILRNSDKKYGMCGIAMTPSIPLY